MTAKDFFEQQSTTDANSVINKHAETYNRFDLIRFAQAYHDSEVKKLNTPCCSYEQYSHAQRYQVTTKVYWLYCL